MKKILISVVLIIFFSIFIYSEVSSSTINWLSKSQADTLYCGINDCGNVSGGGNVTGERWNIDNVSIVNSTDGDYLEVNKSWLNASIDARGATVSDVWVNITGDTMTGNLIMSSNNITEVSYMLGDYIGCFPLLLCGGKGTSAALCDAFGPPCYKQLVEVSTQSELDFLLIHGGLSLTTGIDIYNTNTEPILNLTQTGNSGGGFRGSAIYLWNSNNIHSGFTILGTTSNSAVEDLVYFHANNALFDKTVLNVHQEGVGYALNVTGNSTFDGNVTSTGIICDSNGCIGDTNLSSINQSKWIDDGIYLQPHDNESLNISGGKSKITFKDSYGCIGVTNDVCMINVSEGQAIFNGTSQILFKNAYGVLGIKYVDEDLVNLSNNKVQVNGDLSASGNITSQNVFIPQYIFSHTNQTIPVIALNEWTNITFSQEDSDIKSGIAHTFNDATNHTFMIMQSGIYNVDYDLDIEDTSAASTDIDVAARLINIDGTEVSGSVFETDITKKGVQAELSHNFLISANAGDQYIFQFIASDVDVQISTHGVYGDHPESATVLMNKIANLG